MMFFVFFFLIIPQIIIVPVPLYLWRITVKNMGKTGDSSSTFFSWKPEGDPFFLYL